ncbi:MAG: DUF3078 domain-containing protein [Bacteroidales bacterium]|nr:DUF3078 domain-containing protein [Bacteroidales bacterium]
MIKSIFISGKLFFVIVLLLVINLNSNAQNHDLDTTSILRERDSVTDSLNSILNITDTLISEIYADTSNLIIHSDTIPSEDSIAQFSSYDQILNFVRDSLYFDEPDSIHYVISNLRNVFNSELIFLNDTTKQAINKLIDYVSSREIKPVISYLQSGLGKSELLYEVSDSSQKLFIKSINNAVEYLINSIPEDSIKFIVINTNRDSTSFKSAEQENDSIRVNLFDNRGEYSVLWIKKTDTNVFEIYLEDGTYLEKAKQQKVVSHGVGSKLIIPKLKNVKKVQMIIPIWKFDGLADVRFNQGYISPSWAEGGESSIAALSILKYSADYTYGKIRNFDTDIEYRLGYLKAGENELQKNDDKFEINVKYGKSAFNNWYYSGVLNFKTQFLKGYDYSNDTTIKVSQFLSPAYLVFSLGLDYKPNNELTILFSPVTSKFTIVADTIKYDQTRFGVGQDEFIRKELGAYIKAIYKIKIRDYLTLENKVNFFTNYADNPQNIDVDLEVDLVVSLTDYIKMSINAHFIYDDDVDIPVMDDAGVQVGTTKGGQFKELFGIGFSYAF